LRLGELLKLSETRRSRADRRSLRGARLSRFCEFESSQVGQWRRATSHWLFVLSSVLLRETNANHLASFGIYIRMYHHERPHRLSMSSTTGMKRSSASLRERSWKATCRAAPFGSSASGARSTRPRS
jgi:hypothetical protein